MSAKQSRNQQRKAHYAAIANKASRNQEQLTAPIVGHFETRLVQVGGKAISERVLVHDEKQAPAAAPSLAKREPNAQKRRRQEFAWSNCRYIRMRGGHDFDGPRNNCRSCGCPESEAKKAA